MDNNVQFDELVMETCWQFFTKLKCPEEERTPNNLWEPCAQFVHEKISKLFAEHKVDCSVMRKYLDICEECNTEARCAYFKRMLKEACRASVEKAEEQRQRRNLMNNESRKRRKTAQLAAQLAPQLAAQLAPQRLQRVDSDFSLFDDQDLLVLVLPQFTLQEAARLLAGTCKKMAEIVRGDTIPWEINFCTTIGN